MSQTLGISGLTELRSLCHSLDRAGDSAVIPTNLGLDNDLPNLGLTRGRVHEWLGLSSPETAPTTKEKNWSPPLSLLVHLAHAALAQADNTEARIIWIGRTGAASLWPYAPALRTANTSLSDPGYGDALALSLFVRGATPAQRLWAADLALRSRAAIAIIADASGFDLASTRRLQLAAEAGGGICFLTRPAWEQSVLSASTTRWIVRTCPSPNSSRRWTVSLLRCKGMQPAPGAPRLWTLERDHATRAFAVVPDILDRSHQTQTVEVRRTG